MENIYLCYCSDDSHAAGEFCSQIFPPIIGSRWYFPFLTSYLQIDELSFLKIRVIDVIVFDNNYAGIHIQLDFKLLYILSNISYYKRCYIINSQTKVYDKVSED